MSKFDTHGGYFAPKDYMRVNEGGSHEENPNGGVQIGVDPEGNPNLLEEGEPVYKDYVYSDNIEAEEHFLVDNNLPKKYAGKLYSKIADDLFSEAEERPIDPISRNGLEVLLGRLADAQEGQKQAKEQADLEDELANLSPEELDQLEAMLAQQEQPMVPEQEMVPEEQIEQVPEQVPVMKCGGKMHEDGGNLFGAGGDKRKKQQQMFDEVTSEILEGAKRAETGRASGIGNTDYPLVDKHPGLDAALIAAQPGGILAKALAPSAYRGIVEGLANGESALEAMSPAAKTRIVEQAMEEAYKAGEAASKIGSSKAKDVLKKSARIAGDVIFPEYGIPREVWEASSKFGKGFWPTVGRVGVTIPAVGIGAAIGAVEGQAIKAGIDNKRNSKEVTYSDFDPAVGAPVVSDTTGVNTNKFPDGGILPTAIVTATKKPINVNVPQFVTTPTLSPLDLNPRPINELESSTDYEEYLEPAYVTAEGPKNPVLQGLVTNPNIFSSGIIKNSSLASSKEPIDPNNEVLDAAKIVDDGPGKFSLEGKVIGPEEKMKIIPHTINKYPDYVDDEVEYEGGSGNDNDNDNDNEEEVVGMSLLPTWPRYAGAIGAGLLGLYNAFQQPDKYKATRVQAQTPEGRIHLRNQAYRPIDQNMIANAQIAQGNATNRALRNSGLGPSAGAAILAADNNTTGNLGTGFIQAWDANNQRRNAVIAANNQAEAQRAQFDANMDYYRKEALNKAAMYNAQNDLYIQRLNNEAEAAKYNAISNQINAGLEALSGIGNENFAMNQINTNPAFLGYGTGVNGAIAYNPITRRYERIIAETPEEKLVDDTTAKTSSSSFNPYMLSLYNPYYGTSSPTLYPGSESQYLTVKRKR